jgi:hypothetical protein
MNPVHVAHDLGSPGGGSHGLSFCLASIHHRTLDHAQSSGLSTRPRSTGLRCMYRTDQARNG